MGRGARCNVKYVHTIQTRVHALTGHCQLAAIREDVMKEVRSLKDTYDELEVGLAHFLNRANNLTR